MRSRFLTIPPKSPNSPRNFPESGLALALLLALALAQPARAASQTITFNPIPNQLFGVSPFPIAAQSTARLPVTFTSTTPAVCRIADDLVTLASAGTCSITASQPGNAGFSAAPPVTHSFSVTLAKPSGSFAPATGNPFAVFASGTGPTAVAVGDFNGDGIPDLASANFRDNTVGVLLGDGTGSFSAAPGSPFAAGTDPIALAVGDFNGDGNQDIVLANSYEGTVTVLLGNGSGGFAPATGSPFTVGLLPYSVAVGDFNGDGIQDLATANNYSNNVTVLLGNGSGGFTPVAGSPFAVGVKPEFVAVGDFNGDGFQDLAIAGYTGGLAVLLGNGAGGFATAPGSPIMLPLGVIALAVGDFNGDGLADLAGVSGGYPNGDIYVLLGNGLGGFTQAAGSPYPGAGGPESIVTADFNGDGIQDLATLNFGPYAINILLGDGSGGFTVSPQTPAMAGTDAAFLVTADFNRDGIEDFATANQGFANVTVLLGTGTRPQTITFGPFSNVTYGILPFPVIATASSSLPVSLVSATPSVCTVTAATVTIVSGGACSITASQTGNSTYTAAPAITRTLTVLPASQTITFVPFSNVNYGIPPVPVAATASSGLPVSLVSTTPAVCTVANASVTLVGGGVCSIVANQAGSASYTAAAPVTQSFTVFTAPQTITFDHIPNQLFGISPFPIAAQASSLLPVAFTSTTPAICKLADDLVMLLGAGICSITASQPGNAGYSVAAPVTRSFTVSIAKSSGSFTPATGSPFAVGADPTSVVVADFNGDGIPDLATANNGQNIGTTVTVLLGNGSGGFTQAPGSPFAAGDAPRALVTGDFNGDGIPDLAVGNSYPTPNTVTVLLGNGSGAFTAAPGGPAPVGSMPISQVVGDFNRDGIQDLAVANHGSNNVTILLGNGLGGFTTAPGSPIAVGLEPLSLAVGDFNGDGMPDLVVASDFGSVTVLLGNGVGGFTATAASPMTVGSVPWSVVVGDFNRDGVQDLAIADRVLNNVSILLGNGSGAFAPASGSPMAVEFGAYSLVAGDFNGDGIPDLAVANGVDDLTILLGNGTGGFAMATGSPLAAGTAAGSIVAADFNGDGIEDIAVANGAPGNNVTVLLGLVVGQVPQTIAFGPLSNLLRGTPPFIVNATASSGLPVSFSTSTAADCTVSGNTVNAGGGVCSVIASQAGNATYAAAATVEQIFYVLNAQTINFPPPGNVSYLAAAVTIAATASSGLPVSFASTPPGVCTVSGSTVTLLQPGTCSITASQTGSVNYGYAAAPPVTQSLTVTAIKPSEAGIFRDNFEWILDANGNRQFDGAGPGQDYVYVNFIPAQPGDKPVVGDWNGSGTTKIGIYRPSTGQWFLDYNGNGVFDTGIDKVYQFGGVAGDLPVVGDWNGSGTSKIGIFRSGFFWLLDIDGNGTFDAGIDQAFAYGGVPGDVPVTGDWTGNGITKVGVVRPFQARGTAAFWLLDANNDHSIDAGDLIFAFGGISGDVAITGDWNGSGTGKAGVYRQGFFWVIDDDGSAPRVVGSDQVVAFAFGGVAGDIPVVGKW